MRYLAAAGSCACLLLGASLLRAAAPAETAIVNRISDASFNHSEVVDIAAKSPCRARPCRPSRPSPIRLVIPILRKNRRAESHLDANCGEYYGAADEGDAVTKMIPSRRFG